MSLEVQRAGGLSYVLFDPRQLGVFYAPLDAEGRVQGVRAADVLNQPGILGVLDGPMYEECGADCERLECLYLDRRAGLTYPGRKPGSGMTLSIGADGVHVAHGAQVLGTPDVAVQGHPELVWSGQNIASTTRDTSREWRAGVGVLRDGRMFFAAAIGSIHAFAEQLRLLGAEYAVYTDGGRSTGLQVRGGERIGSLENRAVASWLVIRDGSVVPAEGGSPWLYAGVLALLSGGVWWAARKAGRRR